MAMRRTSADKRVGRWHRTFDYRSNQALATSKAVTYQVAVEQERPLEHLHTSAAEDIKV